MKSRTMLAIAAAAVVLTAWMAQPFPRRTRKISTA